MLINAINNYLNATLKRFNDPFTINTHLKQKPKDQQNR
jgi:hypothetical protein